MLLVKLSSCPWGSWVVTSPEDDQRKFFASTIPIDNATQSNRMRKTIVPPLYFLARPMPACRIV